MQSYWLVVKGPGFGLSAGKTAPNRCSISLGRIHCFNRRSRDYMDLFHWTMYGSLQRISWLKISVVTIHTLSNGINPSNLLIVCRRSVSSPTILSICLGQFSRLRGQNLVPLPPANMTAQIISPPGPILFSTAPSTE